MDKLGGPFRRSMFLSTAFFGIAMGAAFGIRAGFWQGIVAGILAAIGWGGLMSLTIGFLHLRATRHLTNEQSQPTQSREFYAAESPSDMIMLLNQALSDLPFIRGVVVDQEQGKIAAKSKMSWASFGEDITVEVSSREAGKILLRISSRPTRSFTVVDYGKNHKNIEEIVKRLVHLGIHLVERHHGL